MLQQRAKVWIKPTLHIQFPISGSVFLFAEDTRPEAAVEQQPPAFSRQGSSNEWLAERECRKISALIMQPAPYLHTILPSKRRSPTTDILRTCAENNLASLHMVTSRIFLPCVPSGRQQVAASCCQQLRESVIEIKLIVSPLIRFVLCVNVILLYSRFCFIFVIVKFHVSSCWDVFTVWLDF